MNFEFSIRLKCLLPLPPTPIICASQIQVVPSPPPLPPLFLPITATPPLSLPLTAIIPLPLPLLSFPLLITQSPLTQIQIIQICRIQWRLSLFTHQQRTLSLSL